MLYIVVSFGLQSAVKRDNHVFYIQRFWKTSKNVVRFYLFENESANGRSMLIIDGNNQGMIYTRILNAECWMPNAECYKK